MNRGIKIVTAVYIRTITLALYAVLLKSNISLCAPHLQFDRKSRWESFSELIELNSKSYPKNQFFRKQEKHFIKFVILMNGEDICTQISRLLCLIEIRSSLVESVCCIR